MVDHNQCYSLNEGWPSLCNSCRKQLLVLVHLDLNSFAIDRISHLSLLTQCFIHFLS